MDRGIAVWRRVQRVLEQLPFAGLRGGLVANTDPPTEMTFIYAPPDHWRIQLERPVRGLLLQSGHDIAVLNDGEPVVASDRGMLLLPPELESVLLPDRNPDSGPLAPRVDTEQPQLLGSNEGRYVLLRLRYEPPREADEVTVDTSTSLIVRRRRGDIDIQLHDLRVLEEVDDALFRWAGSLPNRPTGTVWIGPSWYGSDGLDAEWHVTIDERVVYKDLTTSTDLVELLVWAHDRAEEVRIQIRRGRDLIEYEAFGKTVTSISAGLGPSTYGVNRYI